MWIVCDGDGFAHSYREGLVDPENGDQFEEEDAAQGEAERLNLKYGTTEDWFRVVELTNAHS